MTYDGPWGGRNNAPLESKKRVGLLLGAFIGLLWNVGMGWVSLTEAVYAGVFVFMLFLWHERSVEVQARRDLMTDLSQNIHDETIDASDLRRARGYDAIEARLERAEEDDDG